MAGKPPTGKQNRSGEESSPSPGHREAETVEKEINDPISAISRQLAALSAASKVSLPQSDFLKQLAALSAASKVSLPQSDFLKQLAALSAASSRNMAAEVASEFDQERLWRSMRNALVHGAPPREGRVERPAAQEAQAPTAVSPQERMLRVLAPPSIWPKSQDARRVKAAASAQRELDVLVLIADIRHSSVLMNEALDPYLFAATLEGFVADARVCVWENRGWFGNFTGDGFLAFWPVTNGTRNAAVKRAVVAVSQLFANFERVHIPRFAANSHNFREDVGLAVGLDLGHVALVQVGEQVTIVGKPVVGASRLVDAGREWEVLANNHLGVYISEQIDAGSLANVDVSQVVVSTKDHEAQRAYALSYEWHVERPRAQSARP
jgi:class 3 adenylate cyclase